MDRYVFPHSDTLSWFWANQSANTNFIVFGLTHPGFEPTIYRTRGEHANHYTTNVVLFIMDEMYKQSHPCRVCF